MQIKIPREIRIKKIYLFVYISFLLFTFIWNVLIILAPYFISLGGAFSEVSVFIYKFFSPYCHQEDSRSFHIFGEKFGVCSRCTLIYLGFFFGSVIFPFIRGFKKKDLPSLWFLLIPSSLLFIDYFLDALNILKNSFISRSITGFLVGAVLPFYIIPGTIIFVEELYFFIKNYKNAGKSK